MINWREHLVSEPNICGGQLCAKGTRVLVTVIGARPLEIERTPILTNRMDSYSRGRTSVMPIRNYAFAGVTV
jgi:hypothetical protein